MATPVIKSVKKAFSLLSVFRRDEWLSAAEISDRIRMPKATGYRLIRTLVEIGALVEGPGARYAPGMLMQMLSQSVAVATLVEEASEPILTKLSDELSLTVNVGVLEDDMVVYLARYGDRSAGSHPPRVGDRFEAYCSGLGKVLLAALPDDALETFLLGGNFVALIQNTITARKALRAEFQRVRKQGYAIDDREFEEDRLCIAAPIRDHEGRTLAALSVSDRPSRLTSRKQERVLEALMNASKEVTRAMFPSPVSEPGPAKRVRRRA